MRTRRNRGGERENPEMQGRDKKTRNEEGNRGQEQDRTGDRQL